MDQILRARALLFDMDGTLVDSAANVQRAYRWWANRHDIPADPILAVQSGRPHREVFAEFAERYHKSLDIEEESVLFADFELRDEDGLHAISGAHEAVKIAERGLWAVVTSAKRELAHMRLRMSGLPMPRALITSESIQHGKPDPECFLLAASVLGVPARECIVFEDALAGVEAAHRAGMHLVGIDPGRSLSGADLLIHDFDELHLAIDPDGWFTIRRTKRTD